MRGRILDRQDASELYLDLLKKCLTRYAFQDAAARATPRSAIEKLTFRFAVRLATLSSRVARAGDRPSWEVSHYVPFNPRKRELGLDRPAGAETMIGLRRLDNIQHCVVDVLRRDVPGDIVETGVWRGGATIFMRGILKAYGDRTRTVWVADSFRGVPSPDPVQFPADRDDLHWTQTDLAISEEEVRANFQRYGLLDEQVRFLPGWFRDTLPNAPIERISVLRLDGDMYESTIIALRALYPKVSRGGYVIVDDYGSIRGCTLAVQDFRSAKGIDDPLTPIEGAGAFWQVGS